MTTDLARPLSRRLIPALAGLAAAVVLAGCAASPTTTYRGPDGDVVTVDWRDYPADAYTDADDVLALPSVEEIDDHWPEVREAVAEAIEAALDRAGDFDWHSTGPEGWHPYGGNGYGGTSMLHVYNSATWEAEAELPPEVWQGILDAAERELAEWGIRRSHVPAVDDEPVDTSHWMQSTDFFANGEFMTVTVQDARRDDEALAEAEQNGRLVSGISLFYGIQTIAAADRAEFARLADPFRGLARPEATHSD